ncbi:hypothetical protein AtEden1_Chr5g0109321 [Arabidopsis thaliana]
MYHVEGIKPIVVYIENELELSVSVVAEIRVQETNTRLVTLSHVDLPKRINDVVCSTRRVGEIRLGGELEESEAELGEDDVRSSEVERFVPPSVIADLMRISMDWILATVRESLASMADWVVSWFGHAILPIVVAPMSLVLQRLLCFAPCRQDFLSGR